MLGVEALKSIEAYINIPSFDPAPDKYDGMSGIILRASDITDESQRDFFLYAKQNLQLLQDLASATVLDKPMFAERVNKVLARWEKLFSTQIREGMAKMVEALRDLKELLNSNIQPPFDVDGMAAHKSRLEDALKEAGAILEAIPASVVELEGLEATAKLKLEALVAARGQQEKKTADMKASLTQAKEKLQETKCQETEIEDFLKESGVTRQDFHSVSANVKETTIRGELAREEVQKHMEYTGDDAGASQPKPVRTLLVLLQSSSCEELSYSFYSRLASVIPLMP